MMFELRLISGTTVSVPEDHLTGMTLENPGYCVECGAERGGCEPDARGYECEACGKAAVYGAEELLLMGRIS